MAYRSRISDVELFARLLSAGIPTGECLDWPGSRSKHGYVTTSYKGRPWYLHRLVYYLVNGPIPDGMDVMHSCDRRHCFFPGHLRAGTRLENMRDAVERGRMAHGARLPHSKLTPDTVRELRALRQEGWTYERLAQKFNIGAMTAWNCVAQKSYKRVTA